jgi:hypothetical protein
MIYTWADRSEGREADRVKFWVDLTFNMGNINTSLMCLEISDNPVNLGVQSLQYEFV